VIAVGQGGLALPAFMAKRWIAPIFLGAIAGAVQFLPFMWGLRWLPPTTTVLYLPPNLIAAMVLGIVALGECLTDELLAGMAFVLMGIAVGSSAYADLRKHGRVCQVEKLRPPDAAASNMQCIRPSACRHFPCRLWLS
jgi:drug/metabolite transporter (DMT)-like permease